MGDWNATLPTAVAAGDELPASKVQTLIDIDTALTGAWTAWTPTLTNITQGNGTVVAQYKRLNKSGSIRFKFTLGNTSVVGTDPKFTLPFTLNSTSYAAVDLLGQAALLDSGVNSYRGGVDLTTTTMVRFVQFSTNTVTSVTATSPFTWGTSDVMACLLTDLELA